MCLMCPVEILVALVVVAGTSVMQLLNGRIDSNACTSQCTGVSVRSYFFDAASGVRPYRNTASLAVGQIGMH